MELPEPFRWDGDEIAIELPGASARFTTRASGNLGLLTGDPEVPVHRRRLAERHGIDLAWRKQVHGARVDRVDAPTDPEAPWIEADGLVTARPGLAPLVLGADCLTVALSDGVAVAAVHAGWHGLEEGVLPAAVARLRETSLQLAATAAPGPIHAAIGPAAGACCYEVGEDLHERFSAYDARVGQNLDLKRIARIQLAAAGVDTVHDVGLCTLCAEPGRLFSHRRDGAGTGRQAGLVWLSR